MSVTFFPYISFFFRLREGYKETCTDLHKNRNHYKDAAYREELYAEFGISTAEGTDES